MLYVRSASAYTGGSSDTRSCGFRAVGHQFDGSVELWEGREKCLSVNVRLSISLFFSEIVFNRNTESKGGRSGTARRRRLLGYWQGTISRAGDLRAYCLGSTDPLGFYLLLALKQPATFSVTVNRACVQTHGVFPWETWISRSNSVH